MTQQPWWQRMTMVTSVLSTFGTRSAYAAQAGTMPLQQFFSQLYTAGTGTYLPMLAFGMILFMVANWIWGWVTMGEMMGKIVLGIAILAGSVGAVVQWVGGGTIGTALVLIG